MDDRVALAEQIDRLTSAEQRLYAAVLAGECLEEEERRARVPHLASAAAHRYALRMAFGRTTSEEIRDVVTAATRVVDLTAKAEACLALAYGVAPREIRARRLAADIALAALLEDPAEAALVACELYAELGACQWAHDVMLAADDPIEDDDRDGMLACLEEELPRWARRSKSSQGPTL